ncbi:trace amine-associated receptor 1-like [Dunckerocampus dactyliophorus]|uniref:trace amine-associated receptor 1-like n=1 Tax=Dunckerocampus dactyliophorus TaxID=161453 RepID=UPI00240574A2|nr:trace amine-associated receptor 1-like [Dunckerocampus dactyliophorus]
MEFIINKSDSLYFCNETEQESCLVAITPSATRMFLYMFIGSAVSISIICGNLLVITSIIYFKQLHTPTNYLILSLAVADLLLGALVLQFNMALSVNSCIYFGDLFCKMRRSFDISLMTTSILNLCCISIDRYYAVCQPLTYKTKINGRVVGIMILVIWVLATVYGFGIMFVGLKHTVCEGRCFIFHIPNSNIVVAVVSFYLPVLVMLSIYLKILTVALKQAQSIQSTQTGRTERVSKMERKATKTLAIVMGVFLFCWTPFFLSMTFNPLSGYSIPLPLIEMLIWLGWSNSMFNPFVYGFFYSWFRAAFKIIISGKVFTGNYSNCKLR